MKTFLKLSILLIMLAVVMVLFTVIESREQYGKVPKTPPTTQSIRTSLDNNNPTQQ